MQTQFLINIYRPTFWSFKYTTCTIEKLHNQLNNYFKKSVIHAYCILMNDELKKCIITIDYYDLFLIVDILVLVKQYVFI